MLWIRVEHLPEDISCSKGYFSWFIRVFKEACECHGRNEDFGKLYIVRKCFHNTCLCLKVGGGGGGEIVQWGGTVIDQIDHGTNLPVVTLFNDMLLGSAPCWGRDSSPAGAAWWIAAGSWWRNHSPAVTATAPPDTSPQSPPNRGGRAAPPTGRPERSAREHSLRPATPLWSLSF